MAESSPTAVECPVCGVEFDPTAAGGWCTNAECGEWKYEGEEVPAPDEDVAEGTTGADAPADPLAETPGDAAESPVAGDQNVEAARDAPEAGGEAVTPGDDPAADAAVDEKAAEDADDAAADVPAGEQTNDESVASVGASSEGTSDHGALGEGTSDHGASGEGTSDHGALGEGTSDHGASGEGTSDHGASGEGTSDHGASGGETSGAGSVDGRTADLSCPSCGTAVSADDNFCPECGTDVSDLEPGGGSLDACPSCGEDVDEDDSFCRNCGENLDAHRGAAPTLSACPSCGDDVSEDDSFCPSCGEDLDAHRSGGAADTPGGPTGQAAGGQATTGQAAGGQATTGHPGGGQASGGQPGGGQPQLTLRTRGREVTVGDGDVVGREFRRILSETGGEEDDAVKIHREHVQFVRESGRFHVVALGDNPTVVNGKALEKDERAVIGPGDRLELSNVLTAEVEES